MSVSASGLLFTELTAPGAGAIRILELRGERALAALRAMSGREEWGAGDLRLARLRVPGTAESPEVIDEALCHVVEPHRVELHVHGSEPVVRELRELCRIHFGLGDEPSESSSLEHRALALVPQAPSEGGARILLDQHGGALRREIERLLRADASELRSGLGELREAGRVAAFALRKTAVVLAGPVNAGKSTLFNLLIRRNDRALMSSVPGTTRDALSEPAFFGPWPVQLYDTAGARELRTGEGQESIERAGQDLAARLRQRADLVFELWPADVPSPESAVDPKVRQLRTMSDRVPSAPADALSVHEDPEAAAALCHSQFAAAFDLPESAWAPGSPAPFDEVTRVAVGGALDELAAENETGLPPDSRIESARAQLRSLL